MHHGFLAGATPPGGLNIPAILLVAYLLSPLRLPVVMPMLRFGELLADVPPFPATLDVREPSYPRK